MKNLTGVLLVNLGTPDSPHPNDVYRYLIEFLTDGRVIDTPWFMRQLLVRGVIVPSRYRQSAHAYQQIWTTQGSPLKVHGKSVEQKLQSLLGDSFKVKLAMRYRSPSIEQGINSLLTDDVKRLIILPLFPQYASATTGSVHERVMSILNQYPIIPELIFINSYATHPGLISSFCAVAQKQHQIDEYDHILFSFHGLPQKHILKSDRHGKCLKNCDCCARICEKNKNCYAAQCYATAREIAGSLQISATHFSVSFQSRLGKEPWLEPHTSEKIVNLAREGHKKVLVFCPAFVCDCLETLYEIGIEYAAEFKKAGGTNLELVQGLNDHPEWINALKEIIMEYLPGITTERSHLEKIKGIPIDSLASIYKNVC